MVCQDMLLMASWGLLIKTYHMEDCIEIQIIGYSDLLHMCVLKEES